MPQKLDEAHPLFKAFVWCAALLGGGLCAAAVGQFGAQDAPGNTASGLGFLLLLTGAVVGVSAIYVLKVTRNFAAYSEATTGQRALAQLVAIPGAVVAATVLLIPLIVISALRANNSQ